MRCYQYIFTPISLLALFQLVANGQTIINVDIYYESLCPDSINFIGSQLVPAYPMLKNYLHINFIPYGKAEHWKTDQAGPWQFKCQHGPAECRGNKGMACALREIKDHIEKPQDQQQLMVDLVGCVMTSNNPETAINQCLQHINLKEESKIRITSCKGKPQGDDLLAEYGNQTNAFRKPLSFVPTIVINGVYSKENQNEARFNFKGLICSLIPSYEKPAVC